MTNTGSGGQRTNVEAARTQPAIPESDILAATKSSWKTRGKRALTAQVRLTERSSDYKEDIYKWTYGR